MLTENCAMGFEEVVESFMPCYRFIPWGEQQVLVYAGSGFDAPPELPQLVFAVCCFHTHRLWTTQLGLSEFQQLQVDLYGDSDDDWSTFMTNLGSALRTSNWDVRHVSFLAHSALNLCDRGILGFNSVLQNQAPHTASCLRRTQSSMVTGQRPSSATSSREPTV